MNRLELRNLVLYWLDDLQAGYFTEPQVNVWLNNAQQEVQKRLIKAGQNYYLKCVQTSIVINQTKYALPEDFKKLNRLEFVVDGTVYPNEVIYPIIPITTNQKDMVYQGAGQPSFYSLRKDSIIMYPPPNVAGTLRLFYSYAITDMLTDVDVPDVPIQYQQLIALLACEDGFLKDGRSNELLQKKMAEYEQMFDTDANERQVDTIRAVVMTGDGNYNGGGYSNGWY